MTSEYVGRTSYPFYIEPDPELRSRIADTNNTGNPNPVTVSFLQWLAATDQDQQELYRIYRRYYDGDQETMLTDRLREFLEIDIEIEFRLNICPVVVDVPAERLQVVGFESGTEDSDLGGADGALWQWWYSNRTDAVQNDIHQATMRDGDTFVLVEWDTDAQRPVFHHELAYDGNNGLLVRYDEEQRGKIKYAVKKWNVESGMGKGRITRMNVYTDDAIYKYYADSKGWHEYIEEGMEWPIAWVDSQGNPLGVPVAHFKEAAGGYDFGKSRLNDIIPIQNALNKSIIDEIAAADVQAFRTVLKSGGDDPTGVIVAPGQILYDSNTDTKWDTIEAGGLEPITALVEKYIMRAAQISRTPLSYFQVTGQVASSDSQKADDKGLVSLVQKSSVGYGNAWEDVMAISVRLSNAFAGTNYDTAELIMTQWAAFDTVDKNEEDRKAAETAQLKSTTFAALLAQGVERRTAALLAGYTQDEADLLEVDTGDQFIDARLGG